MCEKVATRDADCLAGLLDLVGLAAGVADAATRACDSPGLHELLASAEARVREWAGASGVLRRATLAGPDRALLEEGLLALEEKARALRLALRGAADGRA